MSSQAPPSPSRKSDAASRSQLKIKTLPQKKKVQKQHQNKNEESLREILGFFTNQVEVKRFLKKQQIKQGLEAQQVEERTQNEFLNQNEFAEVKQTYADYNYGDLIIVFENPDHESMANKAITFKEAEKIFDEILTVMTDEGFSKQQLMKERNSFLLAFLTLDDYIEDEDAEKQKKKKAIPKYQSKQKQGERLDTETRYKRKEKTSYEKYLDFVKLFKKYEEEQLKVEGDEELKLLAQKKNQDFLNEIGADSGSKEGGNNQTMDPLKELLKVDILDTSQFKSVKKQWSQGKYLEYRQIDENDYEWISMNGTPKDFLTLVRFTIMTKLTRNGLLHCRQFVSKDGKLIYLVLKSSQEVIVRQAQLMRITKQIELGYADLLSLEPVDDNFRPFRLKNYIRQINDDELRKLVNTIPDLPKPDYVSDESPEVIENHCSDLYKKCLEWDELNLRANIIKKQGEVDKHLKIISKELNIDQTHEKVELINDSDIPRNQWEVYLIYQTYLSLYCEMLTKIKKKGYQEIKDTLPVIYKFIFQKSLNSSNQLWYERNSSWWRELLQNKKLVHNIWGKLEMEPVAPYTDYFQPAGESAKSLWRKYQINELGHTSEFINMERIKITHSIVLNNINILKLINEMMALLYYPLHDPYQLRGESKEKFFEELIKEELQENYVETIGELERKKFMDYLISQKDQHNIELKNFREACAFDYKRPWYIPITVVRDYFGEKMALYFNFLSFYIKQMGIMSIVGILAQFLMSLASENARNGMIVAFATCIIVWSSFFIELWKRQQVLFCVQYGQFNFEQAEAERPAFKGKYIRSITNDDLNEAFYSPFKRKMKLLLSLFISFLIIGCVIGCVFAIFLFKSAMLQANQDQFMTQQVPAILSGINIGAFNALYQFLVIIFNNFENHKILTSYEFTLTAKLFLFMFVNNFNLFFFIAFLETYFKTLHLCQISQPQQDPNSSEPAPLPEEDCFQTLESQLIVIFASTFANYPVKFIVPTVAKIALKYVTQKLYQVDENPEVHPFNKIDDVLEDEQFMLPYLNKEKEETDGTVLDYMDMVIQFSYLCLFGLVFPSAYIMGFVATIMKMQADKAKLSMSMKRPFPQGAATIGSWLVILEVITFFGIFSNAGLIVYTSGAIKENQIEIFSVILVMFLAIKYFIRFLVPHEPEAAVILNKRHQYVVDKVVKGLSSSSSKQYIPAKVNTKIDGIIYGVQPSHMFQEGNNTSNRQNEPYNFQELNS